MAQNEGISDFGTAPVLTPPPKLNRPPIRSAPGEHQAERALLKTLFKFSFTEPSTFASQLAATFASNSCFLPSEHAMAGARLRSRCAYPLLPSGNLALQCARK